MAKRGRPKRQGSLLPLSTILTGAYPGRTEDLTLIRTFSWWERAVTRRIAEVARPVRLSHGTLTVHTRSAAWAQELSFHEEDLLDSVRRVVPTVRRIRIKMGEMPSPGQAPDPPPPKVQPLEPSQLPAEVARALAHLGDDELRSTVARAACMALGTTVKGSK